LKAKHHEPTVEGVGHRHVASRPVALAAVGLVLCVALGVLAGTVLAAKGDTSLISRRSAAAGGQGADGSSIVPATAGSGRYVGFATEADNLGGPANDVSNVYVYDRAKSKVKLISRRGAAAGGQGGNGDSSDPSISADGRFVLFDTDSDNLGGPAKDVFNLYVYDRKKLKVSLVSRRSAAAGGQGANGDSFGSISASGRFVVFQTDADNLGGPAKNVTNVYVYDRKEGRVQLVSRQGTSAGGEGADGDSFVGGISAQGRFVVFSTKADNLGGPANDVSNVYVYDRKKKRTQLVSRRSASAGGQGGDDDSTYSEISDDGSFVAFRTNADNLGGPSHNVANVYVYDRGAKSVELVSRRSASAGGQGGNDNSAPGSQPQLSANGRYVAFDTDASNFGGPVQTTTNVYVYDRRNDRIRLASRRSLSAGGQGGDSRSVGPSLSADGRFVAFWTEATNLGGPAQALRNIYIHQLRGS
jgi:Tol biopolymer transport system component